MLSPLRNRFGIPGAISVIALVFAMFGGAYAANNGSGGAKATASAKKGPSGPRGPRGKTGPAGPAGLAGPAGPSGAKGDTGAVGANGKDGTNGTNGVSVTTEDEPAFGECGDEEGVKIISDSPEPDYVCNGKEGPEGPKGDDGEPWVAGQAPTGALMKGTWAVSPYNATAAGEQLFVPLSTGIPVGAITSVVAGPNPIFGCTGTAEAPTVEAGKNGVLCVYTVESTNLANQVLADGVLKTSGGGSVVIRKTTGAGVAKAYGTWALRAP